MKQNELSCRIARAEELEHSYAFTDLYMYPNTQNI